MNMNKNIEELQRNARELLGRGLVAQGASLMDLVDRFKRQEKKFSEKEEKIAQLENENRGQRRALGLMSVRHERLEGELKREREHAADLELEIAQLEDQHEDELQRKQRVIATLQEQIYELEDRVAPRDDDRQPDEPMMYDPEPLLYGETPRKRIRVEQLELDESSSGVSVEF